MYKGYIKIKFRILWKVELKQTFLNINCNINVNI